MNLDASCIYPGLDQGSAPETGPLVAAEGFDTLVLCAYEWQPPKVYSNPLALALGYQGQGANPYPGVTIIYASNDDDPTRPPTRGELDLAIKAARQVTSRVLAGGKVLVTCQAGKNRSGLVTALALHQLTGVAGKACVDIIKMVRPIALTNPQFVKVLDRIAAKKPTPVPRPAGGRLIFPV